MAAGAASDSKDPFSLFGNEEEALRNAEQMILNLEQVADGVKQLADAYRQGLREQRRMMRISDRMQLDLQRANQTLQAQKEELKELNASLEAEVERRKQLMRELHILATVDSLTGVLTRRRLFELGNQAFQVAAAEDRPISVVLMDIDHFKKINDGYGHAFGDAVLRKFGELAREVYGEANHVGRLGGEEFVVVLPGQGSEPTRLLAEVFRETLGGTVVRAEGQEKISTVSIGVASRVADDNNLDRLIARADEALYQAKHGGRNRVVVAG
jgi:diguanylate cyclase (GGDEF)-like protein